METDALERPQGSAGKPVATANTNRFDKILIHREEETVVYSEAHTTVGPLVKAQSCRILPVGSRR